jgi:hypothetical protein
VGVADRFAEMVQTFAGTVLMVATPAAGTPADQFPAVFQSVLAPPLQVEAVAKADGAANKAMVRANKHHLLTREKQLIDFI